MSSFGAVAVWVIAAAAIAGILLRPWRSPEWAWAAGGAALLTATRLISPGAAASAIGRGADVYAFLIGIMILAEIARYERVFDWLADAVLKAGRGSRGRLLALVYGAGAVVTALLSNDTTAIVLTPAVFAALARTDADPLPYLYGCAFVANAASFVLPVSNPANLVVFGHGLPPLWPWLHAFGLPALAAIVLTFGALRLATAAELRGAYRTGGSPFAPTERTRLGAATVGCAAVALVIAALCGWNVGVAALLIAAAALLLIWRRDPAAPKFVLRHVAWGVVPLVAGLFVIVQALDASGAIDVVRRLLTVAAHLNGLQGNLLIAGAFTLADNIFNNLPVALAGSYALQSMHPAAHIVNASLVAVDLGPNLSVTGSLATLLWLIALRRERLDVTPWQFARLGVVVLIPALAAAVFLVR